MVAVAVAASMQGFNAGAWTSEKYHIDQAQVAREHGLIKIDMKVRPSQYRMNYNKQLEIVPVLKSLSSNDSICFPKIIVAGRNSYYYTERSGDIFPATLLKAGSDDFLYKTSTEWADWMEYSRLDLQARSTGCCGVVDKVNEDMPVALLDFRPMPFRPLYHFDVPVPEIRKDRRIEGKAYVNFPVNRIEIYPDYMVNPVELRKITNSVDSVRLNPDATVKSITLTGFASPEGPYSNNVRLAKGRTEAVKEYVRGQYTFPADVFHTNSVPEDWEGLRDSIEHSILGDKMKLLDFIDNGNVPIERRNDEFRRRFPQSYNYLLKYVYPSLRHTNYAIDYEIKAYTDIDEIRRVLQERPGNLSLNEFFIAANSYPAGSPEFDHVFDTAVLYYPNDPVANLNAANSAMNQGDYKRARMLLGRISENPSSIYATAVLDALEGNYDAAEAGFKRAQEAGVTEAEQALAEIKRVKERQLNITYIPEKK